MTVVPSICLTLAGLVLVAGADQVRLKNGHVVEGILAEESASSVVLTVAGGSVSFPRSSIESLVRAEPGKNAALESGWKEKRYLDKAYVPPGFEALADQCRTLDTLRARAGDGSNLKAVADYRSGIRACSQALAAVEATPQGTNPSALPFLNRVREQVRLAGADFRQAVIEPERRGNSFILRVLVNGQSEARFILDTGAEITTLTREYAARTGLAESGRTMSVGLADGTRFEAPVVRINSLRIGSVDLANLEAVILSKAPDEDVDGLLGMNALKAFLIRFEPATGSLQLEQFKPPELH
jgi:clan AA aspartic protease (TIGR02281 family)